MLMLTCKFAEQINKKQSSDLAENVKKAKRQSKYPNENRRAIIDALSYTGAKVPILKNATSKEKEAVRQNNKKYTFEQTCAIDSLYHSFLVGITDNEKLKNHVSSILYNLLIAKILNNYV